MSQTWDVDLISPTGTSPSADIQRIIDGFNTLRSTWSGATEPATADRVAYMLWADTTTGLLKIRNAANTAWITIGTMAVANMGHLASFSQAKSGAYTVVAADRGSLILCTGTTAFSLTFTAAATLGDSWTCIVRNDCTSGAVITLDPNSAELIDGLATILLHPGETAIVYCTGTALKTFNRAPIPIYDNPVINGDFSIHQTGVATTTTGIGYFTDKWYIYHLNMTGGSTKIRSTSVPTIEQVGVNIPVSYQITIDTADTTVGAGDVSYLFTGIEGYMFNTFKQTPLTLSFWAYSSKTGIYCVALKNNTTSDRTFIAEYTIDVANTWEKKVINIPATPVAGNWNYDLYCGLYIFFMFACGTTGHAAAGSWLTTGATTFATSNQVNFHDLATNVFRLTAVKLETGSLATPFVPRPFQQELALCRRYYQQSFAYGTTPVQNIGHLVGAAFAIAHSTSTATTYYVLRFFPNTRGLGVTFFNPFAANQNSRNITDAADDNVPTLQSVSELGGHWNFTPNATNTVGDLHAVHWTGAGDVL
jgi:hypothetical protein